MNNLKKDEIVMNNLWVRFHLCNIFINFVMSKMKLINNKYFINGSHL